MVNETIQTLHRHQSVRQYINRPIEEEKIEAIFQAVQGSPSWINGQQVSIIRITDYEVRQQMMALSGNQSYVGSAAEFWVFCADFYRSSLAGEMENEAFAAAENVDLLLVGATDVGIALGTAIASAESLGLGTVPIGGVRREIEQVIELLQLPQYVLPISGLCIGYSADQPGLKPRLPQQAVVFENAYNTQLHKDIQAYNEVFSNYMKKRTNGESATSWSEGIAAFYREPFYRGNSYQNIVPVLKKQGFIKSL